MLLDVDAKKLFGTIIGSNTVRCLRTLTGLGAGRKETLSGAYAG